MKKSILAFVMALALCGGVWAQTGTPAPTMYTLQDIYDYLNSGAVATAGGHSLEPPAGAVPGDARFKTTQQIYEGIKGKLDQCDALPADVRGGKKFFCAQPGNWGVKTGTAYRGLLKTGQTSVYLTGDDGTYQKGVAFKYAWDVGTDTVKDEVTGLVWASDGTGAGCKGGSTMGWTSAIQWAEALSFAGYTDWRLPNINEIQTLLARRYWPSIPLLDHTFFPNTTETTVPYWSSTTRAQLTLMAYGANFNLGSSESYIKTGAGFVRAVRGGE